ncbi:MAG: polyketide synthase dehydratase domain-containing protein, partial [Burkholderiales bacterium]
MSDKHSVILSTRLAPLSGEVTVSSRTHNESTANLHATAKVLMQPSGHISSLRSRAQKSSATPTRQPDFDAASHRRLTEAVGLAYGESYAAISHGWVEDNSAIAVFAVPSSIQSELSSYLIHPGLLDCAFQLILHLVKTDLSAAPHSVFVPTKIERISVAAGAHIPHSARTTLRRSGAQMLTADVELFDEDGLPIATYTRIQLKRLATQNKRESGPVLLRHALIPAPHRDAREPISAPQVAELFAALARLSANMSAKSKFVLEVEPLLDALCRSTLASFIGRHSGEHAASAVRAGRPIESAAFFKPAGLDYFNVLAAANGIAPTSPAGSINTNVPGESEVTGEAVWRYLLEDYPEFFAFTRLGAQFLATLSVDSPASRRDDRAVIALSDEFVLQNELGSVGLDAISRSLVGIIKTHLAESPVGQAITIAEVCVQPLFAKFICKELVGSEISYRAYLTSPASPDSTTSYTGNSTPCEVISLDQWVSSVPDASDHIGCADVLLMTLPAMDALHSGRPSEYLFEHIVRASKLLAKGGVLLFLGRDLSLWNYCFAWSNGTDQTRNGLAKSDPDWRPNAQFVSVLLKDAGLQLHGQFSLGETENEGAYILAAHSEAESSALQTTDVPDDKRTVVVVREGACNFADAFAAELKAKGAEVCELVALASDGIRLEMSRLLASEKRVASVVYLSGYSQQTSSQTNAQRSLALAKRALIASQLAEAISSGYEGLPLWIVTRVGNLGTTSADAPHWTSVGARSADGYPLAGIASCESLDDAALWGWCRSLTNEHSHVSIRLAALDVQAHVSPERHALSELCHDVLFPNDETEIVYSPAGGRFAPRLKPIPALSPSQGEALGQTESDAPRNLTLRLGQPGLLNELRWEEASLQPVTSTQVRVRVQATGLNFRDVMFGMGLLDEDSIANGFAGPTLGLEFSGVVEQVGKDVEDIKIGDSVLGFGPACFGSVVTTERACVSAMPADISYDGAATIPSAFFTSYYSLVRLARLGRGERVLIHGGAGGVGLAAIQVAKMLGAEIFVTVGTAEKLNLLRLLGVTHIYD